MPGTASNASGGGGSGSYGGGGKSEVLAKYNRAAFLREADELGLTLEQAAALADRYFPLPTVTVTTTGHGVDLERAGYSAGRRDAAAAAAELAEFLEGMEGYGAEVDGREYAAGLIRSRLVSGWPVPLPADSSGSDLAADSAGSELPANLAGSDLLARIAEALERIAATVAPGDTDGHGGWAAPYVRVTTP